METKKTKETAAPRGPYLTPNTRVLLDHRRMVAVVKASYGAAKPVPVMDFHTLHGACALARLIDLGGMSRAEVERLAREYPALGVAADFCGLRAGEREKGKGTDKTE